MKITEEQRAAIDSAGRTIVSASAGSGKTFVMIQKLVAAIRGGVDLDNVLAVTFTKKAAAQMKEKLRSALIAGMDGAPAEIRTRLKVQLSKISSASISTIHAFCAKLLRTYFYAVGIDGGFDIISSDDASAKDFKNRTLENMFERYYNEDNAYFKTLLKCYRKKRGDAYLKNLIVSSYEKLRINADYADILDGAAGVYAQGGFEEICTQLKEYRNAQYKLLKGEVERFASGFKAPRPEYAKILGEMLSALDMAGQTGIFDPAPPLAVTRKPVDKTEEQKLAGEKFKAFKDEITAKYKSVRGDVGDRDTERLKFNESGMIAVAFAGILKDFDREYTAVKREENKLDYNDLEHLTLKLLADESVRAEINGRYTCVFVDEYQDVNPVQERIISLVGGEDTFLVGDVKQAIYGFRGSKSLFFAEKYDRFHGGDGNALRLSSNFRSSDGVINFVNSLFSGIMTERSCGFDYSRGSAMKRGGRYPEGYGSAQIHIFGSDEEERVAPQVYSVKESGRGAEYTREGLAVLEIVERELKSKHYDLQSGEMVDTQAGDICILTRKRNRNASEIVRALTDAGYPVAGAQEANILNRPEVKRILDILSYIDNAEQDIPLTTALLSPLGGLDCDELASIRIAAKGSGRTPFRECCKKYASRFNDEIAQKLNAFYGRAERLRGLAGVFSASEIIDEILQTTGLEAAYSAGGGEKLKNIRRLCAEGGTLGTSALLAKLKDGYEISAPASASSDSIKILTMHASKGLEFPVVIIADVCAGFKGREQSEMLFDEEYGFAPKYFDYENKLTGNTVLRRLASVKESAEELKNELNLFYVACTRAMCNLHVMAREIMPFTPLGATDAGCYSKLFDISLYSPEIMEKPAAPEKRESVKLISKPDGDSGRISSLFMRGYGYSQSVNLPVKSSASAILKLNDDGGYAVHALFSGEGETDSDKGTAYHRFLELCDFSVKDVAGIKDELEKFLAQGKLTDKQRSALDAEELAEILKMPVFSELGGAEIYREREFLCRMPANAVLPTEAEDGVLVQGAIDMLAQTRSGYKIIDYKYSSKSDGQLIKKYAPQLALYKKAVALITQTDESKISASIVNIYAKRQINL